MKTRFYKIKPHQLYASYQNRTKNTFKPIIVKPSKKINPESLYLGTKCSPGSYKECMLFYTRALTDVCGG